MKDTLFIEKLDGNFNGVCISNGLTYTVAGALPGETVTVKGEKRLGREVLCRTDKINKPSPHRVSPVCPYYENCGNCKLMHIAYSEQLRLKSQAVSKALGGMNVPECKGLYYPLKYRNKLTVAFGKVRGRIQIGFYREGTREVTDIKNCLVNGEMYSICYKIAEEYIAKYKVDIYDEAVQNGALRYMSLRLVGGVLCVTVVSADRYIKGLNWLHSAFKMHYPKCALYLNINASKYSNVFGNDFYFIEGERNLTANFLGADILLKPKVFLQVNEKVASYIFKDAVEYVKTLGNNGIIDAYCGAGITSLLFAKAGLSVTGIEIEEQSVSAARSAALRNKLAAEFWCGDAAELLPHALEGIGTVFVDPPRAGLEAAIDPLLTAKPENIIYMSCSLASLQTDLEQFQQDYNLKKVTAYDMFPQTAHVETLVCLTRKN